MSERKNIDIDIVASCVCRDAFVIGAPSVAFNRYNIRSNFQYNSFLSYMSQKNESLASLAEEEFAFGSPWQKRMLSADLKKDVFEKIYAQGSFVIIDVTAAAIKHFEISSADLSLLTSNKVSRPNLPVIEKALGYTPRTIDPWTLPKEYIEDAAERFAARLASAFPAGKIIFTEIFNATEYIAIDGSVAAFAGREEIEKRNEFLASVGKMLCDNLDRLGSPACVVPMPSGVLGFEAHKWGKYSLHFCDEYYEYLLRSYDAICSGYPIDECREIISELKEACEHKFLDIRKRAISLSSGRKERACEGRGDGREKIEALCKKYKTDDIEKYIKKLIGQNLRVKGELEGTRSSLSYKIGRFITFIPRKIFRKK